MMITITYFVHGTTTDNEQQISTGWAHGELSQLGREQAKELGFQVQDMQFDLVFCSDLKRAIDSANLAFSSKYPIVQDSRLREANYGDLNQHHESQFNPDPYWCITNTFPHGESYKDVEERIADFIDFLKVNYADTHVAIVAHKAPQLAFEVLLNKKSWEQAIDEDWRIEKKWQPGWTYIIRDERA
jgi:broad specificity phosphatase PhoE